MSTRAKVAIRKSQHPELYCPNKRCLWYTGNGSYCPRHQSNAQDKPKRDYTDSAQSNDMRFGESPDY